MTRSCINASDDSGRVSGNDLHEIEIISLYLSRITNQRRKVSVTSTAGDPLFIVEQLPPIDG